ncbi:MAG: hypothetical protein ACRCUT_12790, partial [Spirochaetota bacterium]
MTKRFLMGGLKNCFFHLKPKKKAVLSLMFAHKGHEKNVVFQSALIIGMIFCLPMAVFAQSQPQSQAQQAQAKKADDQKKDKFPTQTVMNDDFSVSRPSFTRKGDNSGKGEIMEVSFDIQNNIDNPRNLYVFVIATYEDTKWVRNSFNTKNSYPEKVAIEYFVPFPDNQKNYEYEENGKTEIRKFPKDYK